MFCFGSSYLLEPFEYMTYLLFKKKKKLKMDHDYSFCSLKFFIYNYRWVISAKPNKNITCIKPKQMRVFKLIKPTCFKFFVPIQNPKLSHIRFRYRVEKRSLLHSLIIEDFVYKLFHYIQNIHKMVRATTKQLVFGWI